MFKENLSRFVTASLVLAALLMTAILVAGLLYFQSKDKALGGLTNSYRQISVATSTTLYPSSNGPLNNQNVASSSQIIAPNDSRTYARCYNTNTNGYVVSFMLGTYATTSIPGGIILSPMASTAPSFFEINEDNQFTGGVMAYSQGTSTISCVEN